MTQMTRVGVLAALAIALATAAAWNSLPDLIGRIVTNKHATSPGVARLRVAHQMAGGLTDAAGANRNIADAMKAMVVAKLLGPR